METQEKTIRPETEKVDYLDEDPIIPGQEWICFSYLFPKDDVKNVEFIGMKFRGAFSSQQDAEAHAKELQRKLDKDHHIYVGTGFKWIKAPRNPDMIENQVYDNDQLNDLMKAHKEELLQKKQAETERKKQMMEDAMIRNEEMKKKRHEGQTKERLQKKLLAKKKVEEQTKPPVNATEVEKQMKQVSEDEKKLDADKMEVAELQTSLKKLESMCNKIKEKAKKK
jgi:hypothetical protein